MNYQLTEAQWFSFISGMIVGEWLNSSESNIEVQTIFEPIGVGGSPITGMKVDEIPYTGQEEVTFPLTTHHVNIEYCAFNVILNIPQGLSFLGYAVGDFGSDVVVTQEESKLYIQGFRSENSHIKRESLLCLLKFKVLGTPTTSQLITFQNGDCKDTNSSMLMQYQKEIYWGISPMNNINGGLIVDSIESGGGLSGPTITVPIGEESQTQLLESETDFYTQSGFVCFQNKSDAFDNYTQNSEEVGIIASNHYSRNFWLNLGISDLGDHQISHVDFNFWIFSELVSYENLHDSLTGAPYPYMAETLKSPEWESCSPSLVYDFTEEEIDFDIVPVKLYDGMLYTSPEKIKVRKISMTSNDIHGAGLYSVGCFNLSYTQHKFIISDNLPKSSYIKEARDVIHGVAVVYYTDGSSEEILLSSEYKATSLNAYGVFISEEDTSADFEEEEIIKEIEKDDGIGYTELEGDIYSDCEQDIEIVVGEVKYRVHLKPGFNKVRIKVPSLSHRKQVITVKIKVIVPEGGYILFPLGFTIRKKQAKEVVEVFPFLSSMFEKFFVRDKVSYQKISREDVNLDFLFENLHIFEVFDTHRVEIEKILLDLVENIKIFDVSDLDSGGVAVNLDALFEFFDINEKFSSSSLAIQKKKDEKSEGLGLSDFVIFEF